MIWSVFGLAFLAGLRGMWSPCGLSMLTSLNPMAERSRGYRFATSAGWYVAGALVGGAVLGTGCAAGAWLFGLLSPSTATKLCLAAAAALIGFASDARVSRWSLPDHPRQVNERWLSTYRRWIYAGGFGIQIGFGFATYIMTAAVYVTAALAVLTADPAAAVAICLTFAAVRGLSILVAADLTTSRRLIGRAALLDRSGPTALAVVAAAQAVTALVCAWLWSPAAGVGAVVLVGILAITALIRRADLRPARTPSAITSAAAGPSPCG